MVKLDTTQRQHLESMTKRKKQFDDSCAAKQQQLDEAKLELKAKEKVSAFIVFSSSQVYVAFGFGCLGCLNVIV